MQNKLKQLTPYYGLYDFWKHKVKDLEKKDINFNILDLDDTIFSVSERVNSHKMFQENRAEKWNLLIINELWLKEVTQKWYKNKPFPTQLIDSVKTDESLILTAWIREYQEEKIMHLWLQSFNALITDTWEDKIIALIRYIIFDLKYIPSMITVYEDRPQYFIEYRDLLEEILWCKITIMYVQMTGNKGYKKIEEI